MLQVNINTTPTPLNNLFERESHHGRVTRHSQQNSLKVIHFYQAILTIYFPWSNPLELTMRRNILCLNHHFYETSEK